jgi:hypothetical protein
MFERYDQKPVISTFLGRFVSYWPQFWVSGVIFKAHDTSYMFDRHDQKLIVFVCMAIFVSYCPLFWDYEGGFTWPMTLSTSLRGMTKTSTFLHFWAIFVSYCSQFWIFRVIFKAHDTWYLFDRHDQKLVIFAFMAVFVSYCPLFWGSGDLHGP